MNWVSAASLDQIWRSPAFPMWMTLAAAGFFAIVVLITLLRAEKSVANGALTVITLLAVGIAVAATARGYGSAGQGSSDATRSSPPVSAALPALSCIDGLAGDAVLAACEKTLFGSAESAAAAVSYTAWQLNRLTALGDAATADKNMTPELMALRRAIERDRYGLVAQVLQARDHCTIYECAAFRSLSDREQVAANMNSHLYDSLVSRYAPTWNTPALAAAGPLAMLPPSMPTGRPTNADFPSAASTPPVSIMTPEPGTGTPMPQHPPSATAKTSVPTPHPSATAARRPPRHASPPPPPAAIGPTLISPSPSASNN